MELSYVLMNPSGNVTLLVTTPVPVGDRAFVASELMRQEPLAEQVGYLSSGKTGIRLDMAGGEFCGNATMSAAVCYAMDSDLEVGTVPVEVSGMPGTITVDLAKQADESYRTTLDMPSPQSVSKETLPDGSVLPVVRFDGISHIILEREAPGVGEKEKAEAKARALCEYLKVDALGLQYFDRKQNRLTPLVYVPAAGTMCWESACGSGTAAVGAYLLAETGNPVDITLAQPGGMLTIEATANGVLRMSGTVIKMK